MWASGTLWNYLWFRVEGLGFRVKLSMQKQFRRLPDTGEVSKLNKPETRHQAGEENAPSM